MKVLLAIAAAAALLSFVSPAEADPTCVGSSNVLEVCVWNAVNPAETVDYVNCWYDNATPNTLLPPDIHIRDCTSDAWYVHTECHVLGEDCRDLT